MNNADQVPEPMWFSIGSHVGEACSGDATISSGMRAYLKALEDAEMVLPMRHRGALIEHMIREYAPELI